MAAAIEDPEERRPAVEKLPALDRSDCLLALLAGACLLAVKLACARNMRIDSDEPQHLHTVWGWTQGLLPYRDLFDNHMPLFQWLCAPLFRLAGERPDIVWVMRLWMVPIFFGILWCVWRVGAALHSSRAGLWAALFTGLCPAFFFVSSEFRTDNLWTLCWLLALVVLTGGVMSPSRAFLGGLLAGAAVATSMKTTLLLGSFGCAGAVVLGAACFHGERPPWRRLVYLLALGLLGAAVLPAAVAGFFWAQGAWRPFVYCVFQHNLVPHVLEVGRLPHRARPFYFPGAVVVLGAAAWWILRGPGRGAGKSGGLRRRRAPEAPLRQRVFLALGAAFYLAALLGYWPVLSAEDYEPFYPLLFLAVAPLAVDAARFADRWKPAGLSATLASLAVALLEQGWAIFLRHPWRNDTRPDVQYVADILRLTTPGQYVMDGKCESIFRPRPYYYVMESMTDARFARGLLVDDIADHLIATDTAVCRVDRLPARAHHFIYANYLPVSRRLFVLGQLFGNDASKAAGDARPPNSAREFQIAIPARYTLVTSGRKPPADATLDGQPFVGPLSLAAGLHRVTWSASADKVALIWADAVEKGFSPFASAL